MNLLLIIYIYKKILILSLIICLYIKMEDSFQNDKYEEEDSKKSEGIGNIGNNNENNKINKIDISKLSNPNIINNNRNYYNSIII